MAFTPPLRSIPPTFLAGGAFAIAMATAFDLVGRRETASPAVQISAARGRAA